MGALKLEDFGSPFALGVDTPEVEPGMSPEEVEAERMAAFDQGLCRGLGRREQGGHR